MKKIVLATVLLGSAISASLAQASQPRCAPRDTALNTLADKYGEVRRSMGLNKQGIVEVFSSDDSGSWTITVTTPQGMMCIVAAGEAYTGDPGPALEAEAL
ncbi:MAG: hypothetical protein AAFQ36_01335 [Pseudomonadota bacterium]